VIWHTPKFVIRSEAKDLLFARAIPAAGKVKALSIEQLKSHQLHVMSRTANHQLKL
jgi:hypothetical protein